MINSIFKYIKCFKYISIFGDIYQLKWIHFQKHKYHIYVIIIYQLQLMHCDELSELYNEINSITKIIGKNCSVEFKLDYITQYL